MYANDTICCTQKAMAARFDVGVPAISKRKNMRKRNLKNTESFKTVCFKVILTDSLSPFLLKKVCLDISTLLTNFADMGKIPKQVIKAAEGRKHIGGVLRMFGHYKGFEVYSYEYAEEVTIGMPEIYLWDGTNVKVVDGEEALNLISLFPSSLPS